MQADPEEVAGACAYDALFVPSLIGVYAPIVADAVALGAGDRVLDVACGTGVVAQEALRRVGPSGSVTGLDANAGMLAVAREHSAAITWREGVAEALPFPASTFDAVTCQFGLMFFRDRATAIAEMRCMLRPGGRLAVAVWASLEAIPAFAAEVALFERVCGSAAADVLRAPFALGDPALLAALVPGGAITTHTTTARFAERAHAGRGRSARLAADHGRPPRRAGHRRDAPRGGRRAGAVRHPRGRRRRDVPDVGARRPLDEAGSDARRVHQPPERGVAEDADAGGPSRAAA